LNKLTFKQWILSFILVSFLTSLNTANADENAFGYRIFEMQKKHALKGSTMAQYKLGTFYEFGISVKPNPQEAIVWYKKAAKKRNKRAANRLTYLDVKLNGYNNSHAQWLNKIKDETQGNNIHSTIILGQLHHYGLGVKKNLPVALKLLRKASVNGHTEIDFEIDMIQKQMAPIQTKPITIAKSAKETETSKAKPNIKTKLPDAKPKVKANKKLAKKAQAKRKKYEEAMRKQYREQLILQQQQEWSEGEEWAEEEDESEKDGI